jgi:hypothetical protein
LKRSWIVEAISAMPKAALTEKTMVLSGATVQSLPNVSTFDAGLQMKPGLCIVGYLNSEVGLGQAARCLAYAADAARIPSSFHHLPLPGRENEPEFVTKCVPIPDRKASLLVFGLPSITALAAEIRGGRHNILYPFWELSGLKEEWLKVANDCSEVWAPSTFVADAFREQSKLAVTLVRQPVRFSAIGPFPAQSVGPLTFLSYFDYDSFGARKNPKATVQAFQIAFPGQSEDVRLIVKTRGTHDDGLRDWLSEARRKDARIEIIDKTVDRNFMERLLANCGAFVSLHRSEGFGFGAAEALSAGKPVIATDYSGTTDFIDQTTGFPVEFDLVPVGQDQYLHSEGQVWANPRIDHAAHCMRTIHDHPADARARGVAGQKRLEDLFSPAVIGNQLRILLDERGML